MNPKVYDISLAGLLASYLLFFLVWMIVRRNRLALDRDLAVSTLRMSLQLLAVGFFLKYLFGVDLWYVIIGVFLVMVFFAAHTVMGRTGLRFKGLNFILLVSLLVGSGVVMAFLTLVIIKMEPWYDPRYFIPLAGMVIGNSMNGCALAVERYYTDVKSQRNLIETLVALGATAQEASREMIRAGFRASLLPTLSSMSGMGIVFLPGMMTGQILGGVEPLVAIRYQIVIMMAILGAVAVSSYLILMLEHRRFFDEYHLLRAELFS